jgi:hypothetical protein
MSDRTTSNGRLMVAASLSGKTPRNALAEKGEFLCRIPTVFLFSPVCRPRILECLSRRRMKIEHRPNHAIVAPAGESSRRSAVPLRRAGLLRPGDNVGDAWDLPRDWEDATEQHLPMHTLCRALVDEIRPTYPRGCELNPHHRPSPRAERDAIFFREPRLWRG